MEPAPVPNEPFSGVIRLIVYVVGWTGVIGNLFVVVVTLKHTKLWRQLTCKYIVNQSVIDALALFVLLARMHMVDSDNRLSLFTGWQDDLHNELVCRLWVSSFLVYGLLLASTYNLVAISIERYLGIVRPLWHRVYFTHDKVTFSIVGIWVFSLSYMACVVAVPTRVADYECQVARHWPSQGIRTLVGSVTMCLTIVLPLCIHGFCYARILVALRMRVQPEVPPTAAATRIWITAVVSVAAANLASVDNMSGHVVATTASNALSNSRKKRATRNILKTLAIVTVAFVICWIPNKCYGFLYLIGVRTNIDLTYGLTLVLAMCNCCVNPFIYIVHFKEFRKGMAVIFGCQSQMC